MLSAMRLLAILGLLLATAVAACGGDDDAAAPATWDGPQRPYPESGVLPVEEFRAYAESVDEDWERAPGELAREFVQPPAATGGPESPAVTVSGPADQQVTVTLEGLADDSVAALRYVLELEEHDGHWSLVSARWEQRCQALRGHQDFSPELCV
jgi:ABC-type glycerol-3-phosphate transport system substrate-binding protein